jgi:ribose/xylose/arabinose/galactoside ABC-type transport system permease subunit
VTTKEYEEKASSAITEQAAPKRTRLETLELLRKLWAWVFLVLLVLFFTIAAKQLNDTNFLSARSIQGILVYATQILLVALGQTLVIITAGIDLSVGWTLGLASVVAASVMQVMYASNANPVLTILLGASAGLAVSLIPGWLNGWLVARVKVPPFIGTLGMGGVVTGAAYLLSGGYPVAQQPPYLGQLGNGYFLYIWPGHGASFFSPPANLASEQLRELVPIMPNVVFVTLIVTLICWFILSQTQFGQHVYAIGGNFEAAVRSGIPVRRTLIRIYTLAGLLAGIAGVVWAARFTSGAANAGETTTLTAVAAVVIGGASLFGGEGTITGTLVGSLIIAIIQFGLVILGVVPFWQYVAVGTVVILAVIVDQLGRTLGK